MTAFIWRRSTRGDDLFVTPAAALAFLRKLFVAVLAPMSTMLVACSPGDAADGDRATRTSAATARSFADIATLLDTVSLEQPDSAPIVRISGFRVLEDGRILLADVSEANVKLFSPDGRLLRIIGRQGGGPGEFKEPRFPMATNDGRIIVGEGNGRITFFTADGALQKTISLDQTGFVSSINLLPNGDFVTTRGFNGQQVLTRYDSAGHAIRSYLPFERPPVEDDRNNRQWLGALQFWTVTRGDTAWVWSTLSDSVWSVALGDGAVAADRVPVPGYLTPRLSDRRPSGADPFAWVKQFHIAVAPVVSNDLIGFSMAQGILNYGDPHVFMIRDGDAPWIGVTGTPPVLALRGRDLYGIMQPDRDDGLVVIGRYRLRDGALQ